MGGTYSPSKLSSWWPFGRKRFRATDDGFNIENWMYEAAHNEELFINRDKYIEAFDPEDAGSKDGSVLIPPVGATLPSEFENRLTNAVKQDIQGQAENRVTLMSRLQSELQNNAIVDPGPEIKNVTSKLVERTFTRVVEQVTPELMDAAGSEFETRREYKRFRTIHKRREEPYSHHFAIVLSIIIGMVAVEMALNSFYFAEATPAGWSGGLAIAGLIAAVNVFVCIFAGATIGKYRIHVNRWKAAFAWLATVLFFIVLVIAHYFVGVFREIAVATTNLDIGDANFTGFFEGKSLEDLVFSMGNLVALIGVVFGLIAFYEGFAGISDKYPGYTAFRSKLKRLEKKYQRIQEEFLNEVNDEFDDAIDELDEIDEQNAQKIENFRNRYRQLSIFSDAHLKEMKRAELVYAQLIMAYREANREARTGTADVPTFFSYPPLLTDDETLFAIDKSNMDTAKADVEEAFVAARDKILQAKSALEVDRKRLLGRAAEEIKNLEGKVIKEIGDPLPEN